MLPSSIMRRSAMLQRTSLNRFAVAGRQFQTHSRQLASKNDIMDKDSINTESREYSKSGGDGSSAGADAAFSADKTRPEEERNAAGQEAGGHQSKGNPLNVSPANPEVSQPKGTQRGNVKEGSEGETGGSSDRARTSGGGSPAKAGGGKSGAGGAGTS